MKRIRIVYNYSLMTYTIITPSGVEVEVEAENDAYLQSLKERGYEVKPKVRVYTGESVCVACEG
jgi:hypothetical protein